MIYPSNFEQKIGFSLIRDLLSDKCLSTLGSDRVHSMAFSNSYSYITNELYLVKEFTRIHQEENFPAHYFFDVRSALKRIRIIGTYMDEQSIYDLKRSLETIKEIVAFFHKEEEEGNTSYPHLKEKCQDVVCFPQIIKKIDDILNPYGKIKDNASPLLAQIRRELNQTQNSISKTLHSILRSAQSEGVVDKDLSPTLRDGRLVIPVAPAMKRKMKGIVHDESASGKTVFIEPAEVVEANNRIRELENEERREIIRILTEVSGFIRPYVNDILNSFEFLADIDFIRAKTLLSLEFNAIMPIMEDKPYIDWVEAVHPILRRSLAKHGKEVVPLDIVLKENQRLLIISGPNAGGKSVCLKSVGLLQYMLQCGLPVPMKENSHAGVFDDIFIDIGDEQSIEDDLSTYSSHLTNMKMMLKHCNHQSLLLIDEFGGGTEPLIGGAIAEAVLAKFNEKGAFGVITTHYQNLKHYAEDHAGVINGAMLYDRHQMRPLFQLQIGNPGSSFAVEIARKIGLPEDIIATASDIVGREYINADKYLQDIVRDKRYWESKRQSIRQKEKSMEESIAKYQTELENLTKEKKSILRKAKEEAEELIKQSNAKIENTIRVIKEAQAEKEKTRDARADLKQFQEELTKQQQEEQEQKILQKMQRLIEKQQRKKNKKAQPIASISPEEHERQRQKREQEMMASIEKDSFVHIKGQNVVGEVLEIKGKNAIIAFGGIKTTVQLNRLEKTKAPKKEESIAKATFISSQTQDAIYEKKLQFKQDIDVRGMRGDEAIQAVTYFIDDALLMGVPRVRILHGTGNGILRSLIRQYLATVPGVAHFQDEHVQFGGAGITVVDL